jgi:Rod binding domain-containing protein
MTAMIIGSLTPAQQTPDVTPSSEPTAEQEQAARDFEAIFIRQLLSSLEKGSGLSGGESGGSAVFRSMLVGALADTAAEGGGIGLRELISRAMMPPAPPGKPDLSHQAPTSPMGALHIGEHAGGDPARSARLGVASHVLTQARPTIIFDMQPSTGTTPARSEGNDR